LDGTGSVRGTGQVHIPRLLIPEASLGHADRRPRRRCGARHRPAGGIVEAPVKTTQIAPTTLKASGLNPQELQGVVMEHTQVLPDSLN
jgi:hypothetical protein